MKYRVLAFLLMLAACGPQIIEMKPAGRPEERRSKFHRFKVQVSAVPAEIRHDLTIKEISRLPGAAGSGLKTQGLSTIKHSLATHTRFSTTTGTEAVYAWFDDVILEVAISSVIIHIPKEYPPGTCEYDSVLEHERGHGAAAREQAVLLAGELERALAASEGIPTRFDPVIAANYTAAGERLKADIAKVVNPVYDRYEEKEKAVQAALDRPDPYDAVYKRCDGWK